MRAKNERKVPLNFIRYVFNFNVNSLIKKLCIKRI